jgi:hypothetical protein
MYIHSVLYTVSIQCTYDKSSVCMRVPTLLKNYAASKAGNDDDAV